MDLQTLITILLWFLAVIMFIAVIVLTYILGRVTVKNHPDKAFVFVKDGKEIHKPYKANLLLSDKGNRVFKYNQKNITIQPKKYEDIYHRNRVIVFLDRMGQLIASPFNQDEALTPNERESLIYDILEADIGKGIVRAIKAKQILNFMLVIIIVAVIAIVGYFGYTYMSKNMAGTSQQTSEAEATTNQELSSPIEVK